MKGVGGKVDDYDWITEDEFYYSTDPLKNAIQESMREALSFRNETAVWSPDQFGDYLIGEVTGLHNPSDRLESTARIVPESPKDLAENSHFSDAGLILDLAQRGLQASWNKADPSCGDRVGVVYLGPSPIPTDIDYRVGIDGPIDPHGWYDRFGVYCVPKSDSDDGNQCGDNDKTSIEEHPTVEPEEPDIPF